MAPVAWHGAQLVHFFLAWELHWQFWIGFLKSSAAQFLLSCRDEGKPWEASGCLLQAEEWRLLNSKGRQERSKKCESNIHWTYFCCVTTDLFLEVWTTSLVLWFYLHSWENSSKKGIFTRAAQKVEAFNFIMLAHNIRSRCWWYDSRSWKFPPISNILLPCNRWQQRYNLTEWRLTWKCQSCVTEQLHVEKSGTDIHQGLLKTCGDQTVDVSTVRWWVVCFSIGDNDIKDKPHSRSPCRFLQVQHLSSCSSLVKTCS